MNKIKAWFVAGIIVILAGGFIVSLHSYAIWSYYIAMQVLGWYGLIQAGVRMAAWLQKDDSGGHEKARSYADYAGRTENGDC